MLRLRHVIFSQKCAIASLPYNVLKSYSAAKSSGPNLRTYLKSIKDPNHIRDSELNEILALLRRDPLVDIDAIEVLKCCGSEHIQQTHVLDDIWTELKLKSVPLNVQHYNALLRIYIQKEKIFSPRALFDEIIGRGMNPNVSTCNLLILSCALKGDVDGAIEALKDAQKHDIKINQTTFNNLILAHANAGDVNGMNEIFTTMKTKAMPVDCHTLNNLLRGYAKIGDTDKLNVTFGLFEIENVELLNSDIFNVIFHLDANGHTDKIDEFFKQLFKSMEYRHSARAFITRSLRSRRFDLIEKLLVNNADRCPLPTLARHYLTEAVSASYAENDINQIWHQLETFNVTIDSNIEVYFPDALRSSSTSLVKATLNGMKSQSLPIRDEHFSHLCHLESARSSDAVLDVMRLMRFEFNVRPRCTAIRDTFLPLYEYSKRPQMALAKLLTLDLSITTILTAVITRCILDKRWNDAVEIANMYKKHYFMATQYRPYFIQAVQDTEDLDNLVKFLRILHDDAERLHSAPKVPPSETTQPTTEQMLEELYFGSAEMDGVQVVGEIIHDTIVKLKGDLDKSEKLLERLLSEGLQISKDYASKMQRQLGVSNDSSLALLLDRLSAANLKPRKITKSSHFISPLKLLSPDELGTLIELAESRGKSVAGSKRLLFEAYVSEKNLLAAEELLQDSNVRPSKGMYAKLISLCLNQRDVDKAVDYFERAQTDCEHFYLHRTQAAKMVVLLLLRDHKFEEIQQTMSVKGVQYPFVKAKISSAAINLLQDVSASGDIHLTRELFKHLMENDYIEPTVKTTSALVNVHLRNDNVVEAFNAFEEIYSKYRFTPLKMNLLCKLIQKDDMNRLQQVVEIVASAQGENIALRALAYAFIEADQIEQASIVLSNPVLVQGFNFLRRDCDYFYQRDQINILKGLLKATENLDYDCTEIYRYLFLHFCKSSGSQRGTKHEIRKKLSPDEFLNEIMELLNLEEPKSITVIEKIENVIAEAASKTVETVVSISEEEQLNDKLKQLMSQDTEHISEASEMVLAALESNVKIDPTIISLFLIKAAEMGVTNVYDELWNNFEVRNLPNFNKLYLQAHLNGATPMRYIQKMEKLIEHAKSGTDQQQENVDNFVRIDDNLRFLQEHPHVINEYETMAIKATDVQTYAPINVVWMYHFMSESPFIESLWTQHFASQPDHFQTSAMVQILEEGKCHMKLKKFVDFLVANDRLADAASAQNARLRIYVNKNCFAEANQVLKTSAISVNSLDQTLLDEVRQHSETSSTPTPNSVKQVITKNVHELFQE